MLRNLDKGIPVCVTVTLLDGLVLNQLLQPATELPEDGLVDQLERFFATC